MAEQDQQQPKCEKCHASVTTAAMPVFCPHGRKCAFVEDDRHWNVVEDFRKFFEIERHPRSEGE